MAEPGYRSYIGATGFTKKHEVIYCNYLFEKLGFYRTDHIPMLGFLVSDRTLRGEQTDNKRYVRIDEVHSLIQSADKRVFRTIHYNTQDTSRLSDQIHELLDYRPEGTKNTLKMASSVDGIQLNMAWPDVGQLERMRDEFPDLYIILQVLDKVNPSMTPQQAATKTVNEYSGLIHFVLYDSSGGTGKKVDLAAARKFYEELRDHGSDIGFGIAGGLSPENVADFVRYFRTGPDTFLDFLSIDVESGIRRVSEDGKLDEMSMEKMQTYFTNAMRAFYPSSNYKSD